MDFSSSVLKTAKQEAIDLPELERMIELSAPYGREDGFNRRFHSWKFDKRGNLVQNMSRIQILDGNQVLDECEDCLGAGCKICGWNGTIVRNFPGVN